MPTRFSGAAWARGVGWLGGSSGAQGGLTSALHPLVHWQVLKIYFWDVSGRVPLVLPTRLRLQEKSWLCMTVGL